MKKSIAALMVIGLAIVGCQDNKKSTTSPSALDVTPQPVAAAPAPQPYVPPPQPVAAQPVTYDSPAPTAPGAPNTAAGGNYTVRKGDTLYSIAKARYGSGNQYARIVSANPGLSPEHLKVGQTIVIP